MNKPEKVCEMCEAFEPNFLDEAYGSTGKYKCLSTGIKVRPCDKACHRFVKEPRWRGREIPE